MNKKLIRSILALGLIIQAVTFAEDLLYYTKNTEADAKQAAALSANVSKEDAIMASSSKIDWSKKTFISNVSLDTVKAGIPMPSGKSTSINKIKMELPLLVKEPLLSIYVDDSRTLGDLVLDGTITLDELTRIIDNSKQTPASFENGTSNLLTQHTLRLQEIGSLLVRHHTPYTQQKPIQRISSRAYSGIVIDARGILPVQGEYVESEVEPCLFPKVWDENMTLVYERNMVQPEIAKKESIVSYFTDKTAKNYESRVGNDPLWITAKKVYGVYRCDPVISHDDYLRIATVPENLKLLKEGKIVILVGKEKIAHNVSAPEKNTTYYVDFTRLKYIFEDVVEGTVVKDGDIGIQITVQDLRFIADSAELLPAEKNRINLIADKIKETLATGDYTIMIEGHTADVNKPAGQLTLSIQRAQSIIQQLTSQGIDNNLFTYRGFGGTKPIADNSTPEGRAANRRVEIIIMPRDSYIQRR
ncbi:MAG: OmpA family protein [Treponema sp.]|nr:OmpA family protein [Treponema sp.]